MFKLLSIIIKDNLNSCLNDRFPNYQTVQSWSLRDKLGLSEGCNGNLGNSLPMDSRVSKSTSLAQKFDVNHLEKEIKTMLFGSSFQAIEIVLKAFSDNDKKDNRFWMAINELGKSHIKSKEYPNLGFSIIETAKKFLIEFTEKGIKTEIYKESSKSDIGSFFTQCNIKVELSEQIEYVQSAVNKVITQSYLHAPNQAIYKKSPSYTSIVSLNENEIANNDFKNHLNSMKKVPSTLNPIPALGFHDAASRTLAYFSGRVEQLKFIQDQSAFIPAHILDAFPKCNIIKLPTQVNANLPSLNRQDVEDIWNRGMAQKIFPPLDFDCDIYQGELDMAQGEQSLNGTHKTIRLIEAIGNKNGEVFNINLLKRLTKETIILVDSTYVGNTTHPINQIDQLFSFLETEFDTVIYAGSLGKDAACWSQRPGYIASSNQAFTSYFEQKSNSHKLLPSKQQNEYLSAQLQTFNQENWMLAAKNAKKIKRCIKEVLVKKGKFLENNDLTFLKASEHGGAFGSLFVSIDNQPKLIRFNLIPRDENNNIREYSQKEIAFINHIAELLN